MAAVDASSDPMLVLARLVDGEARAVAVHTTGITAALDQVYDAHAVLEEIGGGAAQGEPAGGAGE